MNNKGSLMRRLTRLGTIPALVVGFLLVVLALLAITVSYTTVYHEEAMALAKAYSLAVEGAKGDPAAMTAVIDDVYFGDAGICFVADKNGNVVATSDAQIVPLSVSVADNAAFGEGSKDMDALSARMLAQENDAQHVFIGADDYYVGFAPVPNSDGLSVAVGAYWNTVAWTINYSSLQILAMAFVFVAIVLFVVRMPIKRIAKPIQKAAGRLNNLAKGDVFSPAPSTNLGGEIGLMCDNLGEMVESLSAVIADIRDVLSRMSKGDLTAVPQIEYKGDFLDIRDSLRMISASMCETMSDVARSVGEVRDGANQLAEGSSSLSENAIAQAAAVDEIAMTMASIMQKTEDNNLTVRKTLEKVRTAKAHAEGGSQSMDDMMGAIREIESSAKEIEQIMGVINDIAFQTSILALNASIEAARAGVAGRGFAVVANEVANLAGMSADAAKQTGELITNAIDAIHRGTSLAGAASKSLDEIVVDVEHIVEAMDEIAQANTEQTEAIEQVKGGMDDVNTGIHNTSATAEESAAASEELSALSEGMMETVNSFKTSAEDAAEE